MSDTKFSAGQTLVRKICFDDGLCNRAVVMEVLENYVFLQWETCSWENMYSMTDPSDLEFLNTLKPTP